MKEIEGGDLTGVKGTALVDFNADWCGPCQAQAPILEELAAELPDVQFLSVNIDKNPDLAAQYSVSSIPCLVILQDGVEQDRLIGLTAKAALKKKLEKI